MSSTSADVVVVRASRPQELFVDHKRAGRARRPHHFVFHLPLAAILLTLVALLIINSFALAGAKTRMEDVASRLSCFCNSCPHLSVTDCTCSVADKIRKDISARLSRGETEDQIIQSYVAQYGQTVLSAPPKSGFNLTPWLIPFLAFGVGGTVLITFLKKQRKSIAESPEKSEVSQDAEDSHYRELLEKELQQRK